MSIRDIIEGATPGPWLLGEDYEVVFAIDAGSSGEFVAIMPCDKESVLYCENSDKNAFFIQAFSPEHVALMEEVVEQAERALRSSNHNLKSAIQELRHYRKERGLL